MKPALHHLVAEAAERWPSRPALTDRSSTLDYAHLDRLVKSVGAALISWGLRRGDRVAVFLDKRMETVVSIYGAAAADGVFVPINPLLKPRQVAYILDDCSVRLLVTSAERWERLGAELPASSSLEAVVLVGESPESGAPSDDIRRWSWDEFVDGRDSDARVTASVIDADIAAIFYTSGSTGMPKGVVLSHRNLLAGAESVSHYLGNDENDVILAALPLSFDAGFSQLTTGFHVGAHVVLHNFLLARDLVRACAEHRVTGLTCVPPLWMQIAGQEWKSDAAGRLRYFANTGGRMPRSTLEQLRATFATPGRS